MSRQPTSQPGGNPSVWFDDPCISNDDTLFRGVRTVDHLVRLPNGKYGVSDQLWTSTGGGCSTELGSLLAAANEIAEIRSKEKGDLGASKVGVGDVRSCMNREDAVTRAPHQPLGVAYTPIAAGEPNGPNPYHCDIFPIMKPQAVGRLGKPGSRNVANKATVLYLDQAKAAEAWAERHGLPKPQPPDKG